MARQTQATQQVTRAGLVPTLIAVTVDGDVIDAGQVALMVANGGASPINVTVLATASQDGLDVEDLVVAVDDGDTALIGPFPLRTFGQPTGANESGSDDAGRAYVDYSATTSVTAGVVRF
jgi:hypothetical protein